MKDQKRVNIVKFPIGLKIVLLNTTLAVIALSVLMTLATYFIRLDVQLAAEQSNHAINTQAADAAESKLQSYRDNVALFVSSLSVIGLDNEMIPDFANLFFNGNPEIALITVPGVLELGNEDFFFENEVSDDDYKTFLEISTDSIQRALKGETVAINATSWFNVPSIALIYPLQLFSQKHALVNVFSVDDLVETFGSGSTNSSYMINDTSDILIHPDFDLIYSVANMANVPIVAEMINNNDINRQIMYVDDDGVEFLGVYTKLSFGGLGVITTIEADLVLEGVNATLYQNTMLASAILFFLILLMRLFSNTITKPVKVLADVSEQIEQGHFNIDLKPKSRDEIGLLTSRFVSMCKGLETFSRFVNLDIAQKAMKGDLLLGGESKNVTVFFSDIRDFTAMSEKLEPQEVIEFLNEYMSRMVECVRSQNGAVDKYIGDAIMAVWGASSTTGDAKEDALNAIKASLLMRASLKEFNEIREKNNLSKITVGCGLNSGSVVAGQMGSINHMEYTVLGDAVNLASRTEMLTKLLSVDILITEETYSFVKDHIIVERMPSVTVKGKEKPVSLYAVINTSYETDIPGTGAQGPSSLQALRTMLDLKAPDLAKIDVNSEERKYRVE